MASAASAQERKIARVRSLGFVAVAAALCVGLDLGLDSIIRDSSIRQIIMLSACNILVALSLNVINGMAGQFSIGHAGFIGIGGYTSAIVSTHLHVMLGGEVTFAKSFVVVPISLVCSAIFAGAFGFVVGLPSLRLKGDYLAIVTLGFAEIFRLIIATAQASGNEGVGDAFRSRGVLAGIGAAVSNLGGQNGYAGMNNEGVPLYAGPFWIVGLCLLLGLVAWRMKFSGWGRALRALREDEIAAAAVGVDPTRYKVTSFVIAAIGAGIAGGLMAMNRDGTPTVQPDMYNFQASFDAITMVILGGSGSVTGAAIGGVFVTLTVKAIELVQSTDFVQNLKRTVMPTLDLNALRMIIYAAVLIALMIVRPEGVLGERELFDRFRRKNKPNSPPPPTPTRSDEVSDQTVKA